MHRATKFGLKKLFISVLFIMFAGHFFFSNFVAVIPKNFQIPFYQTSTSETSSACESQEVAATQEAKKGFPLSIVTNNGECGGSNEWLLAGFLNAIYFVSGTLIFGLFRFNIIE